MEQDPFTACHDVVNVTQYVANCQFDYCCCNETQCEDCYCDELSSYASVCADAGVAISTSDICRKLNTVCLVTYSELSVNTKHVTKEVSSDRAC